MTAEIDADAGQVVSCASENVVSILPFPSESHLIDISGFIGNRQGTVLPFAKGRSGPAPAAIPQAWHPFIEMYLVAQRAAGRPETTIGTRRAHLARLARAVGVSPTEVTGDSLLRWFAEQVQWKQETRRGYRNTISGFFGWAASEGLIALDPARNLPKIKPMTPAPMPAPDRVVKQSLVAATPRVMLMLQLANEAGLRRCEVARVHSDDLLDGVDGPMLMVHGKGDKDRLLPISDELAEVLEAGAAGHTEGADRDGWLFPGQDGGHLSPRWVGKLCAAAMPGVWTMHKLRHRFATKAYRGSRNLRAVQTLLGHASVATTERYTAVDDSELRAAMNAAREISQSTRDKVERAEQLRQRAAAAIAQAERLNRQQAALKPPIQPRRLNDGAA